MGQTITQKLLARHAGLEEVRAGQIVQVDVDLVFANDVTGTMAIREMERHGFRHVFDPGRIVLSPIHFGPNVDVKSAGQVSALRNFAREYGLQYFEPGRMGIDNVFLCQAGYIKPGDLIIGGDSHATTPGALGAFSTGMGSTDLAAIFVEGKTWLREPETVLVELLGEPARYVNGKDVILALIGLIGTSGALYQALEFAGLGLAHLNMDDRMTLCNMSIEAGAKNGIIAADAITAAYLSSHQSLEWAALASDTDASYARKVTIRLDTLGPMVAKPFSPGNVVPVNEVRGIRVDQVVIGSCTNGKITDLRQAAEVMRGRRVAETVRCIVVPATQEIYLQALREGLIEVFLQAGCFVSSSTCGPCAGFQLGVLDRNEVCVSTTPRNFRGRMGHPESQVYLSGPYVAAATAVAGEILHPEEVV